MNNFVSIVIPFYNDIENIEKCVHSLFLEKSFDFEVIVVNDGSSQNIDFIKKYKCKVINLHENKGAGYARNIGVKESKGDIILFIDSDCIAPYGWIKEFSEELVRSNKACKTIAAITGKIISNKSFIEMSHSYSGYAYVQSGKRRYMNYLNTACLAVFKNVFEQTGGFCEDMLIAEDCDFALKLVESGYKIIFEPKISVFHNHGILTFKDFLLRHKEWGFKQGIKLAQRHKKYQILYFIYKNPVLNFLSIVPLSFLTVIKITYLNIRYDKKILLYSLSIFLSKNYFRWGIFLSLRRS